MATDKISPSSGTGSSGALSLNIGSATSRYPKVFTFELSSAQATATNKLTVEQDGIGLFIDCDDDNQFIIPTSEVSTVHFGGTTNAKYLQFQISRDSPFYSLVTLSEGSSDTPRSTNTSGVYMEVTSYGDTYNWELAVAVPANYNRDVTHSIAVIAADDLNATSDDFESVDLSFKIFSGITVEVNPETAAIGHNGFVGLTATVYNPNNIPIETEEWKKFSENDPVAITNINPVTKIATVSSTLNSGDGEAHVRYYVNEGSATEAFGDCQINIYAPGTITANPTYTYNCYETNTFTDVQGPGPNPIALTLYNIDVTRENSLVVTVNDQQGFISTQHPAVVQQYNGNYYVDLAFSKNTSTTTDRVAYITVTGTDVLGDTKSCSFELRQTHVVAVGFQGGFLNNASPTYTSYNGLTVPSLDIKYYGDPSDSSMTLSNFQVVVKGGPTEVDGQYVLQRVPSPAITLHPSAEGTSISYGVPQYTPDSNGYATDIDGTSFLVEDIKYVQVIFSYVDSSSTAADHNYLQAEVTGDVL